MTTVVLVQQGGTGANSAAGARDALGAMANTGGVFSGQVNISSGGLVVTGNANIDSGTLFVDSVSNQVGVGTTAPDEKLHVYGRVRAQRFTGNTNSGYYVQPDGTSYLQDTYFTTSGTTNGYVAIGENYIYGAGPTGSEFEFRNDGNSFIEHGRLGIGLKVPTSNLHVVGTANITSNLSVGGIVESRSGGIKFPDGTTQTSAATGAPSLNTVSGTTVTAIKDNHYILTNASATTVTLPASPANGDIVWVTVVNDRVDNVIARNGQILQGLSEDMTLDNQYASAQLRYINSTYGWRLT
jgi:hypothetical protein